MNGFNCFDQRQVVIFGAVLCSVMFVPVAHCQQQSVWNGSHSNWLVEIAGDARDSTADDSDPLIIEATEEDSTDCAGDWGCCYNMCPCAYFVAEALLLDPNIAGGAGPLVVNAVTGAPLLLKDDLNFPFAGGLRAYMGHRLSNGCAWELGYFGVFGANAANFVTGPGNLALPGGFAGLNVFFGADRVDVDSTLNLNGAEFNVVNCCSWCDDQSVCGSAEWLYGFRYLRIDGSLNMAVQNVSALGAIETGSYNVQADNDLYGGQIGTRRRVRSGLWSLEGTGKVGLFFNDASQKQTVVDFPAFVVRQTSSSDDQLAFLGELNATLIRQINDVWAFRAGYNLIWIDGIALAPNQLDFTLAATSGTTTHTGGTLFLHGANLGVEARW